MDAERTPRQSRSRATLERLIASGRELFIEGGWPAVTVNEACRRASVPVGSFYARFGNREQFVATIGERLFTDLQEVQDAAFADVLDSVDLAETIRRTTHALAAITTLHGTTMSRLLDDPLAEAQSSRTLSSVIETYTGAVLARRSEIAHPEPEYAVAFTLRVCLESLTFRTPANTPDALRHDPDRHVEDLARMAYAFLTTQ